MSLFALSVNLEKRGAEIHPINAAAGTSLMRLAQRLAACDFTPADPAESILGEIQVLLSSVDRQR